MDSISGDLLKRITVYENPNQITLFLLNFKAYKEYLMKIISSFFVFVGLLVNCFAQDLKVVQIFPKEISLSSTFSIETTITKGSISGFVKFVNILPAGFVAEQVDSKGGDFTFDKEEGVRIIWVVPPIEPVYTISYKVKTPAQVVGNPTIIGKISYINGTAAVGILVVGIAISFFATPLFPLISLDATTESFFIRDFVMSVSIFKICGGKLKIFR